MGLGLCPLTVNKVSAVTDPSDSKKRSTSVFLSRMAKLHLHLVI